MKTLLSQLISKSVEKKTPKLMLRRLVLCNSVTACRMSDVTATLRTSRLDGDDENADRLNSTRL